MAGRKPKSAAVGRSDFAALLADVKDRIQAAQTRAVLAVNAELVRLYWDIGRMIAFYREYPEPAVILPQPAAKLIPTSKVPQPVAQLPEPLLWSVPWAHHVILMDKVPDHRPDPLPDARPAPGRAQLLRHRQTDRHLDL